MENVTASFRNISIANQKLAHTLHLASNKDMKWQLQSPKSVLFLIFLRINMNFLEPTIFTCWPQSARFRMEEKPRSFLLVFMHLNFRPITQPLCGPRAGDPHISNPGTSLAGLGNCSPSQDSSVSPRSKLSASMQSFHFIPHVLTFSFPVCCVCVFRRGRNAAAAANFVKLRANPVLILFPL